MLLGHLIEDESARSGGGNAVDGEIVAGSFFSEGFGEGDDAGLGGAVSHGVGVAFLAGDGGDVDDAAVVVTEHVGDDGAAAEEDAGEVDVEDLLPIFDGIVPCGVIGASDAGVGDEDVDAPVAGEGRLGGVLDGGSAGDVNGVSGDGSEGKGGGELCLRVLQQVFVAIPEGDGCAGIKQARGDGEADALSGAGDNGGAMSEIDLIHVRLPKVGGAEDASARGPERNGT